MCVCFAVGEKKSKCIFCSILKKENSLSSATSPGAMDVLVMRSCGLWARAVARLSRKRQIQQPCIEVGRGTHRVWFACIKSEKNERKRERERDRDIDRFKCILGVRSLLLLVSQQTPFSPIFLPFLSSLPYQALTEHWPSLCAEPCHAACMGLWTR